MEHRGVRYEIRKGIEREQWRVAIYLPGDRLSKERTVFGTREDAEITARSMINTWLKKQCAEPLNRKPIPVRDITRDEARRIAANIAKLHASEDK
jgi:hypothetical protein